MQILRCLRLRPYMLVELRWVATPLTSLLAWSMQTSWCGDGVVDKDAGEECDDANDDDRDNCIG